MKLHPLDVSDIEILEDVFPFVKTDVVHNLELEKNDYNIAAASNNADAGHDLWAFLHDNRLKIPFWYTVAKGIKSIQSSSAFFMEQMFSNLRACLDERQKTCYSDRIRAPALIVNAVVKEKCDVAS